MVFKIVTAIIRRERLGGVQARLIELGVAGITVTPVQGFGEYADYLREDLLVPHVRLEIFTSTARVRSLVEAIAAAANTGHAGDGVVAVTPLDEVVRIRTGQAADPSEL